MKTILLFSLMATISLPAVSKKPKWTSLRAANLPARVRAITWENYTLDSRHGVTWGAWTVNFDSERPVAKLNQCDDDACPAIEVSNLVCSNSVVGTKKCSFFFAWTPQGGICQILNASDKLLEYSAPMMCNWSSELI